MSTINIIGAGGMAAAIAALAAKAGHSVEIMSRDPARAEALVTQIGDRATTGVFAAAPAGDLVVLAVPYMAALDVVKQYGEGLSGKVLIDITNPIKSDFSAFLTRDENFGAQEIARVVPIDAHVIKAFNTVNSRVLSSGQMNGEALDIFIAGDGPEPKARVIEFIESLGLRPLDAGPLSMARALEHACMLVLGLVTNSIGHANFSIGVRRLD